MKKTIILSVALFTLISCGCNVDQVYQVDESDLLDTNILLESVNVGEVALSEKEIEGLILMREEEKLAYDVYRTLYDKWGKRIFDNISASEMTHMEAVGALLVRYNLDDPIKQNLIGEFNSPELQKLYNELIEKGDKSLLDALIVGITIEDLDIYDLENLSLQTQNLDILGVYDNLTRGSRNHMRAFYKNILREGGVYSPVYISQEGFDVIVSSNQEKGGNSGKTNHGSGK